MIVKMWTAISLAPRLLKPRRITKELARTMNANKLWSIPLVVMLVIAALVLPVAPTASAQTNSSTGCKAVVGTHVFTVPNGTVDEETGTVCNNGVWGTTPDVSSLVNVPSGQDYARTTQLIGGWQRIREGSVEGAYFPWNYFTRIACDRPLIHGEVSWDHPTLLGISATSASLICQIELKRDLESSRNWRTIGAEMDPYDSSLRGPDGLKQGVQLGWFLGSNGGVASINGSQSFVLDISVCVTCTVPTDIESSGVLTPTQWFAPPSDTEYAQHDAAVVVPFLRNSADEIVYVIQLEQGQSAVLWEGILVDEISMPENK